MSRYPDRAEKAGPDGLLKVDAIVDNYWHLHRQQRSAWSHEDRPAPLQGDVLGNLHARSRATRSGAERMQLWPASIGL